LDDYLKLICFLSTSVYSALGVSAIMRYINRRFTYLLTLLTCNQLSSLRSDTLGALRTRVGRQRWDGLQTVQ